MKFKKGDEIIVTLGRDKSKKGKIEKIFPREDKVLVAGVNMYKRHLKTRGQGKPGGIIDITKPLPVANIALICSHCGQPTRIGYKIDDQKKRICRKCKEEL
ncbi:50S ribosomal protein L24 [Candidatus Microgenomates bacterium]|nr:50S ribosomal protein L24 [Candidatus Microgenomates bacterium]